jgi:dUTP pyrophosphatase
VFNLKLNVLKSDESVPDLQYAKPGDVAFDLRNNESEYVLIPMEHKIFKTGISMEIPEGFVGNIRDRSGMAGKFAIHVLGGIIDPGYRGEIGVVLINLSPKDFTVEHHMRIAQMLIQPVAIVDFENVKELSTTERGAGGFGSTGHK